MKNVILKAALITVGVLVAAGILIFSLWILIAPQSMATVSEKLGNYNFAVTCADLKYKYSGDTGDLARCAEDSILSGEDKLIIKYCEKLIDKDDFDKLCRQRDEEILRSQKDTWGNLVTTITYKTYILSTLSVSQYRAGDLEKAVRTAERSDEGVDCFRKLIIEILLHGSDEDLENVQSLPESSFIRSQISNFIALLTGDHN